MVKRSKAFSKQKFAENAITLDVYFYERPLEELMSIFRQLDNNYLSPKGERLIADINEKIMEGTLRYENSNSIDAETGYYRILLQDLFRELACFIARQHVVENYTGTLFIREGSNPVSAKQIPLNELADKHKGIIENVIDAHGGGYELGDVVMQLDRTGEYRMGDTYLVYE